MATTMIAGCGIAVPAVAQEMAANTVESITVVGQRAMMANSIGKQRDADIIESVVTRDAIGQFPDQNVAEAASRLTGMNLFADQGEGRYLAIRGLDPNLNSSSINGVRIMSPEAGVRQVALDVVPSELVESIEVIKTLTPDMDADTLGASVRINTTKGFDRKDPFFSISGEAGYNDLNKKISPKVGIDFALPINDKLGIAGGASYNKRLTSTDNSEMSGWTMSPGGVVYANNLEYRDYDVARTRAAFSGSVDFKPVESTTLYLRALYSIFNDTEKRQRLIFTKLGTPASGDANTATFDSTTAITVRRDLKDRYESQIIQSYQLGGVTAFDGWKFEYEGSFTRSTEHQWHTQDPTRFEWKASGAGKLNVTFDYADLDTTLYTVNTGSANFLNTANYGFKQLTNKITLSTDHEWAYHGDITRSFDLGEGTFEVKAGGKVRLRNKSNINNTMNYTGYAGTYTLASVAGHQTYGLTDIEPLADLGLVRDFNKANAANFVLDANGSYLTNVEDYYDVDENVYAGYGMARYTAGPLMVVGGLRVESTEDTIRGNKVNEATLTATPVTYNKSYTDWLPSAAVRYSVADDVVLRGGVYKSLVRPNISDMAPSFVIASDLTGSFGNPDLNPYRAWNFDLSAEYYLGRDGVIQVGAFYKDISNFIVGTTIYAVDYPAGFQGITGWNEASVKVNGNSATTKGFEFNYQQALTMLPDPLDGVLVGFNYTFTDASGDLPTRRIPLSVSSKHTFNAMLGYEKGRWSLRGTAAYRSGYLDEDGVVNNSLDDRYVKSHLQFDASVKYKLSDNVRLYADFVNLNNEPYLAYQHGVAGQVRDRLLEYETYSWTGKFGARMSF
jgi:TonB-dependent receptor